MSSWRVLTLSQQYDTNVPQLLVKTCFEGKSYSVFLTDLSNIWSEELDLAGIVDRASSEQSPIEVSTQDCTQLAILLDNVQKSLRDSGDATCLISHAHLDGINIQTSITLPDPLGQLRWKFCLEKRTSTILKNELILPLLVSSHIQHERINDLISKVTEKDKAITRLLDQYESSNLDLAAAFPSISGLKVGRKYVRRDQVARHVPALQNFHETLWRGETEKLESSEFTTLELFQEALSQCTSSVPSRLKVDSEEAWWTIIPNRFNAVSPKPKPKAASAPKVPEPIESEDETEDEFETHENFKLRNTPKKPSTVPKPTSPAPFKQPEASDDGTTDDDEDLDAPLKTGSQNRSEIVRSQADRQISPAPEASPPLKPNLLPTQKPKGFRIGGKAKNVAEPIPTQEDSDWGKVGNESKEASMPTRSKDGVEQKPENHDTQKTVKKGFKIGGKGKGAVNSSSSRPDPEPSLPIDHVEQSKGAMAAPIAPPSIKYEKKRIPTEETHEETVEEKAERKRSELKRKNEELVKKQAQTKKKKRF